MGNITPKIHLKCPQILVKSYKILYQTKLKQEQEKLDPTSKRKRRSKKTQLTHEYYHQNLFPTVG